MSHSRLRDIIVLSSDGEASDWWSEDAEDLSPQVSTRSSIRRTGLRSGRLSQGSTLLNEASKHQLEHKGQIDVENSTKGPAKEAQCSPFSSEPKQWHDSVEERPTGRFWLDHVAIPLRAISNTPSQLPQSQRRQSLRQTRATTVKHQSTLAAYGIVSLGRNANPTARPISSHSTAEVTARSVSSMSKRNHVGTTPAKRGRSARLRERALASESSDLLTQDESDTKHSTNMSSFEPDGQSKSSQLSQNDEESSQSTSDDFTESDSEPRPVKRFKPTKIQSTLHGKTAPRSASSGKAKGRAQAKPGKKDSGYQDSWTYKSGIDESLPPLHDIKDIFRDLTSKGLNLGFQKVIDHLGRRKLKIATMCSGTESPILALDLISESLKERGLDFDVEHLFSGEIVPFKQAYIERNFRPPIIFRDICEMNRNGDEATTAYGSMAKIPKDVDMLVAGFSCVDFSNLNNKKQTIEAGGESGATFNAVCNYAKNFKPRMIVVENVCSAPWGDIQEAFQKIGYAAEFLKLDTKQYYIPHTRQRGYMFCIHRDYIQAKNGDHLVEKWEELMISLRRPASSSIEAFLLPEDDPRIQRGREELVKGAAGEDRGPRDVDWTKCQGRHQNYRASLSLGFRRPMTNWEDNGSCKMPDYSWGDWGVKQVERIWDTLEISWLRGAKRGYDSLHKTRVWDLSQNIDRFVDTTYFGITGCITPTGIPFLTNRGGPMIGLEALSMQGLPIEKLLLTRENQRQLQDLAGNAMTSTVVGSAMVAALIAGHKALDKGGEDVELGDTLPDPAEHLCGEEGLTSHELDLASFRKDTVASILSKASNSSRLCLCEGRSLMTSRSLQRCQSCGHTTCHRCGGNPSHNYQNLPLDEIQARIPPADFEDALKDALPMRMRLAGLTEDSLKVLKNESGLALSHDDWGLLKNAITPALGAELRFHSLRRAQVWTAVYDSPRATLELLLNPMEAEWRLFAKPALTEPGNSRVRELLRRPFARMKPTADSLMTGQWQFCFPMVKSFLADIQGIGECKPSWEAILGLQEVEFAEKQVWSKLRITIADKEKSCLDLDISGDYELLQNCGGASGSLHVRQGNDPLKLFLFLDPTRLGDPKYDQFVFSTDIRRLSYGEERQVVARVEPTWRPSKVAVGKYECQVEGQWVNIPQVALTPVVATEKATVAVPQTLDVDISTKSCGTASIMLSCNVPSSGELAYNSQGDSWTEIDRVNERAFFGSFAWLTERVRKLKGFDQWSQVPVPGTFEGCQRCAPASPPVKWMVQNNKFIPYEDPKAAGPYEIALKNRPTPFITQVRCSKTNGLQLRIGLNAASLIHRSLSNLPHKGSSTNVATSWRLSTDYTMPSKIPSSSFTLRSNKGDKERKQPLNFQQELRPEQLRSLSWMRERESCDVPPFMEEEIEEALLPHLGWRAEAKSTKEVFIRGGVLADEVGYGKTAVTLGLIASDSENEEWRPDNSNSLISIKATLIVVPAHLIEQWSSEIGKFLGNSYKVISIKTQANLTRSTIKDFQSADIILVAWSLFQNETYLTKLAHFAALPEMPSTTGRAFEAWYDYALGRVSDHVNVLKANGAATLQRTLKDTFMATENDEALTVHVPSKRLRGVKFREAQAAKAAKSGPKSKKRQLDDDLDIEEINSNSSKRAKLDEESSLTTSSDASRPRKGTVAKKSIADPFGLGLAKVKGHWTLFQSPLLQMFKYKRLVVDEFTYVDGKHHTAITKIQAGARWILSGTPPLGDFADVKTIAVFLGIHLGVDDEAIGVLRSQNIKALQKERTDVEKFQAFRQSRSPMWHQHRNEVAQRFLDNYVRQNVADIEHIKSEEHIRGVHLPGPERAIYLELYQHMMAQDMTIRKGKSRIQNDREERLNQALDGCQTPEEALLKRCSHFTPSNLSIDQQNALQACEVVLNERRRQYENLVTILKKDIRRAKSLRQQCEDVGGHYDGWVSTIKSNSIGDPEANKVLEDVIATADRSKGSSHDSEEEETFSTKQQELRELTNHLRGLSKELVSRQRSLRFFAIVQQLQLSAPGSDLSPKGQTCSGCGNDNVDPASLWLLTLCGHTACDRCMADAEVKGNCVKAHCTAPISESSRVRAIELCEKEEARLSGRHYGRKLEAIVNLVKHEIPNEERVLLFVQFEDLMAKVEDALSEQGVSHVSLSKTRSKAKSQAKKGNPATLFQTDTSIKVLLLNLADETASGLNLTVANHVIFMSPLFATSQYKYESAMTQAIGRARRFGQEKTVHIYQFLALRTIDVDIIEERTGRRVAEEADGRFSLRKVTDDERRSLKTLGSGGLRTQYFDDRD